MNKDKKILYLISALTPAALLAALIADATIGGRIISACVLAIAAAVTAFFIKKRSSLSIHKREALLLMTVVGVLFVTLTEISGTFLGFYKNPYFMNADVLVSGFIPITVIIITIEIIRITETAVAHEIQNTDSVGCFPFGGGFGGAALAGLFQGVGLSTAGVQTHSYRNSSENRRYEECRMICQKIEQAVEDGKRGAAAPAAQSAGADPLLKMIEQIKSAPDLGTVFSLQSEIAHQATNLPEFDWSRIKALTEAAVEAAKQRIIAQETGSAPVQEAPKPKFCPNCGAPYEGGKFCQSCGSKLV